VAGKYPGKGGERQHQGKGDGRALSVDEQRQNDALIEGLRLGKVETVGIAPGAMQQVGEQQLGDVHQHQAHKNFAGIEASAQQRRDGGPGGASHDSRDQDHRQGQPAELGTEDERHAAAANGTQRQLAFGTDVPDIGRESQCQPQAAQRQRRRLEQQLPPPINRIQRLNEKHEKRIHRLLAEKGKDHETGREHRRRRNQRGRDAHDPGRGGAFFEAPGQRPPLSQALRE
jgi:hypothetical protein